MPLEWRGAEVRRRVVEAVKGGINDTLARASVHAKQNHPWRNRTGVLEGSIRPVVAAEERGDEIVGVWGSADVKYAIFLELGGFPFLRPAADAKYPELRDRIRSRLT